MAPQVLCPVMIGRDTELAAVEAALKAATAGHGGCVVITGEPGIGKSRLALEAMGRARARGVRVVTGRAVPQSGTAPYRPLTDALMQLLRDQAIPADATMEPWRPALTALLPGMAGPASASGEISPAIRAEALIQLLRRLAPEGLVLLLEDLHWADPDTVALMEYLGEHLDGESLLCVVTLRADRPSNALAVARRQRGRPGVVTLALDRLSDDDMVRMARACMPDAAPELLRRVQTSADGVPLLVEDLLASPGLPESFAGTIRERLAGFSGPQREVIEAAAILGRHFDWELLSAVTGHDAALVGETLELAVGQLLMSADGAAFWFRHALTRDAVLDTMLPPRQRALARAALSALDTAYPRLDGDRRELAAELASRAGDRRRAGLLLGESGRQALAVGALATAIGTLRRAADLLEGTSERDQAELGLVEALALAGLIEEAAAAGGQLITRLGREAPELRTEVHLRLSQAAVAASRWQMANHHLGAARRVAGTDPSVGIRARTEILEAEVTFAEGQLDEARRLAETVLAADGVAAEVRCHALELVGRSHRLRDLGAARAAFEQALVTAETARLPLWRLRALHELGTIDMFDHAGTERLAEARRAAERMGALITLAILDLQLAAAFTCRWDLDTCDRHARDAVALAQRLGLHQVRAKALTVLAGSASMRADAEVMEHYAAQALAADPDDRAVAGICWAARGTVLLLAGDGAAAVDPFGRGMDILARLPNAEPAGLRALWPLLLAARHDHRAEQAVKEARQLGVDAIRMNRSVIDYAEAILLGRDGQRQRATELAAASDAGFTNCESWAELARLCAAPAAFDDGWGDPARWLTAAEPGFGSRGLDRLADRCRELRKQSQPNPWLAAGVTAREAEVLRLVADGLANKEIADRLHLSPRTVEKHVESLLRKLGVRTRTALAPAARKSR
ncbi:MAG TPA: AAA family ATPase [Streptosporangiaceae bacterium]|nr:AAA family ATPase [Streptosporangiaceae bacterium]